MEQKSNGNKIFILGGAGFVGSNLACRFENMNRKYSIGDINNKSKDIIKLDIENLDSLDYVAGSQTIINLAAVHRDDVRPLSRYDDVNVQGSVNVCQAARKHGINKIIFTIFIVLK